MNEEEIQEVVKRVADLKNKFDLEIYKILEPTLEPLFTAMSTMAEVLFKPLIPIIDTLEELARAFEEDTKG